MSESKVLRSVATRIRDQRFLFYIAAILAAPALAFKDDIVGMSALLTTTMTYFPVVAEALQKAGLTSEVKVMIGGAPVTGAYADEIGADGFAEDCTAAVDEAALAPLSR